MKEEIFLSRAKYAHSLVKKFGLEHGKMARTPMILTLKITKHEKGASVDQLEYKSMIGGLLYLKASRSNIAFISGICERYQGDPRNLIRRLSNVF